jgi:hypothetical protein
MPNPNVMGELGYVAKCVGWENVIPVFNLAYGQREQLPFDIRHRHIVSYQLAPNDDWEKVLAGLVADLTGWIRASLKGIEDKKSAAETEAYIREWKQQNQFIAMLRQEFKASNDNISPAMNAGGEPLPKEWVEARLVEKGIPWRRERYWEYDQPASC